MNWLINNPIVLLGWSGGYIFTTMLWILFLHKKCSKIGWQFLLGGWSWCWVYICWRFIKGVKPTSIISFMDSI